MIIVPVETVVKYVVDIYEDAEEYTQYKNGEVMVEQLYGDEGSLLAESQRDCGDRQANY